MMGFFIAVGVLCAISLAVALLVRLAKAPIERHGACTITINGGQTLKVAGGRSLLVTLKDDGIFIPSVCGGRGACGRCKVRIESGAGEPSPKELARLSADERENHVRLACQVEVRNDVRIEIPASLLAIRQFATTVTSMRDLTDDIKEVTLKLMKPDTIVFRAGQFIQFEVPPGELAPRSVFRAYSISSPPSRRHEIELEIRCIPNGICTTYVHRHLKVGDTVSINGPHGDFFLRDSDREMICVAGGSGMAPIKSILMDMAERGIRRTVRYFFGARTRKDLFVLAEMEGLATRLPGFEFIPALSDPAPDDRWTGEVGLITEVVARHVRDAKEAEAYLCGSPFMIDACVKVLKEKGLPDGRTYYDRFA